jgi:hypothetical protein
MANPSLPEMAFGGIMSPCGDERTFLDQVSPIEVARRPVCHTQLNRAQRGN